MFNEALTRLRAPLTTLRAGDTVADWSGALDELAIVGANVQPLTQDEIRDAGQDATTQQWRVYTRPHDVPDVEASDRIRWNGDTFDVAGPPQSWPDPVTGYAHHLVFVIERVRK